MNIPAMTPFTKLHLLKNTMKTRFVILLLMAALAFGIPSLFSQSKMHPEGSDALASHIDSTVQAREDFFLFANGKWFKENPIPASEPYNGLWQMIQDTINSQIRNVCESSAALTNAEKGSNKQKIGDFFYTGMDSVSLNKKGISDLKNEFEMIDGIQNMSGVIKAAAYIHAVSASPI